MQKLPYHNFHRTCKVRLSWKPSLFLLMLQSGPTMVIDSSTASTRPSKRSSGIPRFYNAKACVSTETTKDVYTNSPHRSKRDSVISKQQNFQALMADLKIKYPSLYREEHMKEHSKEEREPPYLELRLDDDSSRDKTNYSSATKQDLDYFSDVIQVTKALKERVINLECSYEKCHALDRDLARSLKEYEEKNNLLQKQCDKWEVRIIALQASYDDMKHQNEVLQEKNESLEKSSRRMQEDMENMTHDLNECQKKIRQQTIELQETQQSIQGMEDKTKELETAVKENGDHVAKIAHESEASKRENRDLSEANRRLKDKVKELGKSRESRSSRTVPSVPHTSNKKTSSSHKSDNPKGKHQDQDSGSSKRHMKDSRSSSRRSIERKDQKSRVEENKRSKTGKQICDEGNKSKKSSTQNKHRRRSSSRGRRERRRGSSHGDEVELKSEENCCDNRNSGEKKKEKEHQ